MLTPLIDMLFSFILEVILSKPIFFTGKILLKVITLGKFPPKIINSRDASLVSLIGMLFYILLILFLIWLIG